MTVTPNDALIHRYAPMVDGRDELLDADGRVRDHWAELTEAYESLGVPEMARRRREIELLLEQDGVTYNVPTAHGRPQHAWTLDPIPFVVPGDEWTAIERGVIQRAELLDLVLQDIYGERRLLRAGVVPPAMIFADPQFFRACDGIRLPGEKQLVVYGADLARCTDGRWLVLGQRTQAPSGAAYAVENRRVLSRVFPQLFHTIEVQRLAPFIRALRSALVGAAPLGVDDPSIVILSPGALSETAFEHASLAAQLGYPLVEGSDLEVRGGRVGMRAIGGWVPVDVILRRVDAGFCDPLELRPESTLGIAGLLDACRTGAVSVVNTLGSGVLENAGLAGLMPALAKHLLGSELQLQPAASWWCGDDIGRSHVLANLGTFTVRPLSRWSLEHAIDTTHASAAELDELRRRIDAHPEQWVGQERVTPASAPVLGHEGIEPRAAVVRAFAVAHEGSYLAMSGGLARAARGANDPIVNPAGAISKDVWVLSTHPENETGFWLAEPDEPMHAPSGALPPRAAEYLFWLGRYAERAEATVRLLRTVSSRRDEFQKTAAGPGPASLVVLLEALTRVTGTYPGFVGDDAAALTHDPRNELFSLVVDERRPGTVAHAVRHMFDAINVVRDQLSVDTWLVVGSLQRELEALRHTTGDRDDAVTNVLDQLLHGLLSLSGLAQESMVRDHGWRFMDAGRRIERAVHVVTLVGSALGTERSAPAESLVLESVLTAAESIITYRRRYRSSARVSTAIDLLFRDAGNPRSLRFQIDRLTENLAVLRSEQASDPTSAEVPLIGELVRLVDHFNSERLAGPDEHGHRGELEWFVNAVRNELAAASNAISAVSFTRLLPQQPMVVPYETRRMVS